MPRGGDGGRDACRAPANDDKIVLAGILYRIRHSGAQGTLPFKRLPAILRNK